MEDSLSITKDIGEYYINLKDNSNLIAKGYEKINGQSQNKWMSGVTDYDYENGVKV